MLSDRCDLRVAGVIFGSGGARWDYHWGNLEKRWLGREARGNTQKGSRGGSSVCLFRRVRDKKAQGAPLLS